MKSAIYLGIRFASPLLDLSLAMEDLAALRLSAFLDALDQYPEAALSVWLPGRLLESLPEPLRKRLAELARGGRLELLQGLFYAPDLTVAMREDLAAHFAEAGLFWDSYEGSTLAPGAWLPQMPLTGTLLQALPEALRFAVVDANELPAGTPAQFLLDAGWQTLVCLTAGAHAAAGNLYLLTCDLFAENELPGVAACPELLAAAALFAKTSCCCLSALAAAPMEALPRIAVHELLNTGPVQSWLHTAAIRERLAEVRHELSLLPEFINTHGRAAENARRLAAARNWFLRAQEGPGESISELSHNVQNSIIRSCIKALLHAQVEIDSIRNAEIDPIEGWLTIEQRPSTVHGGELFIIDNPFLRMYCAPAQAGGLVALEYKPRKFDILSTRGAPSTIGALGVLLHASHAESDTLRELSPAELSPAVNYGVIRRNPGVAVFRMRQPIRTTAANGPSFQGELYKDFTVKSGVGAHLGNSTTGFSLEYWLESEQTPSSDLLLSLDFPLMLQSGNPECMSARALLPVGGVAEHFVSIASKVLFDSSTHPAGVYGVRLIDGIEHWIIEFRSAKPMARIEVVPVVPREPSKEDQELVPSFGGILLRLILPAASTYEDHRSNMLFISIP